MLFRSFITPGIYISSFIITIIKFVEHRAQSPVREVKMLAVWPSISLLRLGILLRYPDSPTVDSRCMFFRETTIFAISGLLLKHCFSSFFPFSGGFLFFPFSDFCKKPRVEVQVNCSTVLLSF